MYCNNQEVGSKETWQEGKKEEKKRRKVEKTKGWKKKKKILYFEL